MISVSRILLAVALVAACVGAGETPAPTRAAAPAPPLPPLGAPLRPPLAPPLTINGGFGDYRAGHFHAGFDFGTGGRVGKPVRAPANGWVERIRASGVGYGRSLYVRIDDGRTLQFGHLDAFAAPVAAYVRHAQDSTGQYEQDLWPETGRFKVRAGAVIAYTGESGAGGPHLHFEIRRGDMAYQPVRAGLIIADPRTPTLPRLTFEPLDDRSAVEGGAAPRTFTLGKADTVRAVGRLRVVVDARNGAWSGVDRNVPWSVGIEWEGRRTECRFDSVSWATDMKDGVYVHDAARVIGEKGLVLWAPPELRPRVIRTDASPNEDAGTIIVTPADPPRPLRIWARDVNGREVTRTVIVRPGPTPPDVASTWRTSEAPWIDPPGTFTSLPRGWLRWSLPARGNSVTFQFADVAQPGTRTGDRVATIFAPLRRESDRAMPVALAVRGSGAAGAEQGGIVQMALVSGGDSCVVADPGALSRGRIRFPAGAVFEMEVVLAHAGAAPVPVSGLEPVGDSWVVEPANLPLRTAARVTMRLPDRAVGNRVGLYRQSGSDWSYVGAAYDSLAGTVSGESRDLGRFALFRDTTPPAASLLKPAPPKAGGAYSRWAVEANASDAGSGVDARGSYFEIDETRVATEWDPEKAMLRWRPERPAARGMHRVVVVVADRAGNITRESGSFRVGP